MSKEKCVYFFGGGKSDGRADMKEILGGKGANLAEMTNMGIPVPPGFTISTEVCKMYYDNNRTYPDEVKEQVKENLLKLEQLQGKKLGNPSNPLLVSIRSGAKDSMPGMMDTVLNLGLNDKAVEGLIKKTKNERFVWDAYRRFIQMFGDVAMNVPHHDFEEILESVKKAKGIENDVDMDVDDLKKVVKRYKELYKKHIKKDFPQDPMVQLWAAIDAVFGSWNNDRAIKYRALNNIKGLLGTAVNVQTMVFG
ncbi:MAG: pyruvate, phosphate dikinase, partial [Spirochaetaceae bacterium]|nr:pyruvate, phosphate dikinase [Spirochaetaceae bacterium]